MSNSNNNNSNKSGGVGFLGILTIVFIVLKLLNKITWSWLWVLSPTWIPLAIIVFILLVLGIITYATNK